MNIKVLYDGAIFDRQMAGGINRYFANLISQLPDRYLPYLTTYRIHENNYPQHPHLKTFYYQRFIFRPNRLSDRFNRYVSCLYFNRVTAAVNPDLIHPTYYNFLASKSPLLRSRPIVLTVWDMIHELFWQELDTNRQHIEEKKQAILAATTILCISENTKKDLLKLYEIPEDRVRVTYLASEINCHLAYGDELTPQRPYFLYIGTRYGYKNFSRLLDAFSRLRETEADVSLCIVGSPLTQQEQQAIVTLKIADRIEFYGQVNDRHLAKLYRCSVALVYPSLYEGFGIPPLEAMACGTAVIASNRASIPEVVGDAGILFDPNSTEELAYHLRRLLNSPAERDRWIEKGRDRAKLFSWKRTIQETLNIYQSLV
jgi:glycosyltransferase involved in cell wall biosynthesis